MTSTQYHDHDVFTLDKKFIFRKYKGEGVLVDREQQQHPDEKKWFSFQLNKTGCIIIEQIKAGSTFKEIIHTLSIRFDIPDRKAEQDANDFISVLLKIHVISKK